MGQPLLRLNLKIFTLSIMATATQYRRAEIKAIKLTLESQKAHYEKTSAKFKRWHTRGQTACALTGGAATILTGSGLATSLSAVGIVVGGPLIAAATVLSLAATSLSVTVKFFLQKAKKHQKILLLAEETLLAINSLTSAALEDGKISDDEYQEIVKKYAAFTSKKTKLRYSYHVDASRSHQS